MIEQLDRAQVQGIVASAYLHLPRSAYVLLKIDPARVAEAKRWLAGLSDEVRTAEKKHETSAFNVAFTFAGLRALGLSQDVLQSFSVPFIDGMRSERRKRILGDPEALAWGDDMAAVDILLLVYAPNEVELDRLRTRLLDAATSSGVAEVACIETQVFDDFREHFGFVDGIGQPVPEGLQKAKNPVPQRDVVKNGEFLLGYVNEYGVIADTPLLGDRRKGTNEKNLGRNGTYLVFRQASQDVGAYRAFIERTARANAIEPELLAAKAVGRWKNGAPLVQAPYAPSPAVAAHHADTNTRTIDRANDFGFAEDPKGLACPLGAHIRRANPRDGSLHTQSTMMAAQSARHRLLRRGRSYGPRYDEEGQADKDRGLCFIALCADLERQFEFIQQTWINNAAFNDLDEVDPLLAGTRAPSTFTIQETPMRRRIAGMQSFVTLRGGAYFFVPSIAALAWLAK